MSAPESPAETVRRGAEKMRRLAQAASDAGWTGATRIEHDAHGNVPIVVSTGPSHVHAIADVMNDAYAEHIAAMDPSVALLIADQWGEIAGDMADYEAYVIEKLQLVYGEDHGYRPDWTKTLAAALKFLGEAP